MPDQPTPPISEREQIDETALVERQIIPLLEEQLLVGKRTVTTGALRLEKQVVASTQHIDLPLQTVTWHVTRVPMDVVVAAHPPARQEGDTMIYPVVEERVVVTRELVLREEVRVTREVSVSQHHEEVTLHHEELLVQHVKPA